MTLVYCQNTIIKYYWKKLKKEKLNHGEYVGEEDYYNDDSDKSDIDAN